MKIQAITILTSVLALAVQAQAKVTFEGIDTNWRGQQRNRWRVTYDASRDLGDEITADLDLSMVAPRLGSIAHGDLGDGRYYYDITLGKGKLTDTCYFLALKTVFKNRELCAEMGLEPGWMTDRCTDAGCRFCGLEQFYAA
ncbi:hypothetical protein F5X99DRAFT_429790 [Biscogniauxia marginata]|nr:hypothetical protein F5X99DRAFT_429790 [Biscogniauxia marginata]